MPHQRHVTFDQDQIRRVRRNDAVAKSVITAGGVAVIITVIGILFLILSVAAPLFQAPESAVLNRLSLPPQVADKKVMALGIEEYIENAGILTADGDFHFFKIDSDTWNYGQKVALGQDDTVLQVEPFDRNSPVIVMQTSHKLGHLSGWIRANSAVYPGMQIRTGPG